MAPENNIDVGRRPIKGIEFWLNELHDLIERNHQDLLELFNVFAGEARFAREWLEPSLNILKPGSQILEVGAGLMLVSCQLVREGYLVTALEPMGEGFSGFLVLQSVVLNHARSVGVAPLILESPVERLDKLNTYDLAFSINVMEHIENIPAGIANVTQALVSNGIYRFTCPNYIFPYEPHFNIPTLFSKKLTERIFRESIVNSRQVEDPIGLWKSLNWINVITIIRACRQLQGVSVKFDRSILECTFMRVLSDAEFASRRSHWTRVLVAWLVSCRVHKALALFPAAMHPIIDCTLVRIKKPSNVLVGGT